MHNDARRSSFRLFKHIPIIYKITSLPDAREDTLLWLVAIRGNVGLGLLGMLVAVLLIPNIAVTSVIYLMLMVGAYILVNGIFNTVLSRNPSPATVRLLRHTLIPMDVLAATLAIYFSGGPLSPMFIVYSLSIPVSIILLEPRGVYSSAGLSVLTYSVLVLFEVNGIIPNIDAYWGGPDLRSQATPITYALYVLVVCTILMAAAYIGNRIAGIINQRNRQIEAQVRDLQTLYDIANGLGNLTSETEVARYLAAELRTLQNATTSVVAALDRDGRPTILATAGTYPEAQEALRNFDFTMPEVHDLLQKGRPLIVDDIEARPELKPILLSESTRSLYLYPVLDKGEVIGAVGLCFDTVNPLGEELRNLLQTITNQAAVALQRARLFNDTQRLAREMSTLYDLGLYTGSTLSTNEVVKRTADNIETLMDPDMYYVALYDAETESMSFEVFKEDGKPMPRMRASLARGGLTARIIKSCKPLLVQDWATDGRQYAEEAQKNGADMLSYLGVPMISNGKVTGVLSVQSTRPRAFDWRDQGLLQAIAAQTAMALENARLHKVAQDNALLDSLTRVYNHGYFIDMVNEAVANSDGDDSQVSLIMLDIDHFKRYNDTFGHVAGDNVLVMVAEALQSCVRETDVVGRWGGEEFAILLPNTGLSEAKRIARTIRRAVADLAPVDGNDRPIAGPTISQGISTYPQPSASADHLIEEADAALYHAKKHGRNQLVVWEPLSAVAGPSHTTVKLGRPMIMKDATITTGNLKEGA